MTVGELIRELQKYSSDQEVEICRYTSVGSTEEMSIQYDLVEKTDYTRVR